MGIPPLRVTKDKNLPDLFPTDTSDDNNKGDTQDNDISSPARKTSSQSTSLSIMENFMLSCCQMSRTAYQIDLQKSPSQKYPLKLFCELAEAVLDEETGDLLEYCHLAKHPNHKKIIGWCIR